VVHYSTSGHRAASYGVTSQKIIKFKNPLVLSVKDAYDLSEKYGTINNRFDNPLENAERMTKDLIKQGYDGLIAVTRTPKFRLGRNGYAFSTPESNGGELEIVDYRPYMLSSL